ncbi:MAG: DUF3899 domain-containing protein [Oscillospiraceae bacterium]|nr:DUF3899 domain-containing protein [Oscillospiraceae bacterium]
MEIYRILSDFFAVPGLFCLFLGTLWWLAGQGAFRGANYVWGNALRLLTFQQAKPYKPKENKGRATRPLLITGAVLLAAAGIFAGLYYS